MTDPSSTTTQTTTQQATDPAARLSRDDETILAWVHKLVHPTTDQLHRYAFGEAITKRAVRLKIAALVDGGYLTTDRLYPERGARSPRYYSLTAAGGRALGIEQLGGNHYRPVRREYHAASGVRIELAFLAHQHQWRLVNTSDRDQARREARVATARGLLATYLTEIYESRYQTSIEPYQVQNLIPAELTPDLVLDTPRECLIVVVAHPHSGSGFWTRRLRRYAQIIAHVRIIAVVFDPGQERSLLRAIATENERAVAQAMAGGGPAPEAIPLGRFLVVQPGQLAVLEQRLS